LSAIDLDFHPVRSRSRRRLQTLLTYLYGSEPEATEPETAGKPAAWGEESVPLLPGPAVNIDAARIDGAATLSSAAGRLAKLISDIHDRAPLHAKITPV
jgi:hypothetical protein